MNVKSIYETLAALGTGALIVGCGAPQTPVNTAEEAPVVETATATATNEADRSDGDALKETPAIASPEEKPSSATTMAASSPAPVEKTAASPEKTSASPEKTAAATAKPVQKKSASTAKTTAKTTAKAAPKKDASSACGEGGCG